MAGQNLNQLQALSCLYIHVDIEDTVFQNYLATASSASTSGGNFLFLMLAIDQKFPFVSKIIWNMCLMQKGA